MEIFCRIFFSFVSFSYLVSCGISNDDIKPKDTLPMFNIELKENEGREIKEFDTFFSKLNVIPLKVKDSSVIASVDKIEFRDSTFIVLDKKFSNLYKFNYLGHLLTQYGKVGLGPGEYKQIDDFEIKGNFVYVLSNNNRAIFVYSLQSGKFIKKIVTNKFGSSIAVLSGGNILLHSNYNNINDEKDYNIYLLDENGTVLQGYFPFNPEKSSMIISFSGFLVKNYNSKVFFCNAFDETVYVFNEHDNTFEPYSFVEINNDFIKENKEDHNRIISERTLLDPTLRFIGNKFFENDDYIIFSYYSGKVRKLSFYGKKEKKILILRKGVKDPIINLINDIQFVGGKKFVFSISKEVIDNMEKEHPEKYAQLGAVIKNVLENNPEAEYFVLVANKD